MLPSNPASGEAVLPVGEAGHDVAGAAEAVLQRHVPRHRRHVRRVVALRPHRPDHRGDQGRLLSGIVGHGTRMTSRQTKSMSLAQVCLPGFVCLQTPYLRDRLENRSKNKVQP